MKNKKMSLWETVSIAVGTMIGASIFSIFGIGAQIAGKNLPIAFILSGIFALIVAYSYAILGRKIISNAGPIQFIIDGMGDNIITGSLAVLMWLSYVVSISLFTKGFSGYFVPLFHLDNTHTNVAITEIGVVLLFTVINFFGSKLVGRLEFYIVLIKLAILGVFAFLGFSTIKMINITPVISRSGMDSVLYASVVFFLSYMGFGLVTNASENIRNPEKNVPRAIFISIAVVIVVYVSVSLVAIGNLSIPDLVKAKENALAVAAKPFLGNFGFLLLSIGAIFSISSALNATLYGGTNVAYSFAKEGELPEFFDRKVWFGSTEGLYITSALSIIFTLWFNIESIAAITSTIYTIIYIFVLISHYRLIDKVGGNKVLVIINTVVIFAVFAALVFYQWQNQRNALYGCIITLSAVMIIEIVIRSVKKRNFDLQTAN